MDVVDRYLELGLRLGRHVDGLVDAYYGPEDLRERVEAEALAPPAALAADAATLADDVAAPGGAIEDARRRRWLRAQLAGLETVARTLAGERLRYADEVERCYGVRPERVPEETFDAAHRTLEEALPGTGDLGERYREWLARHVVPRTSILVAFTAVADALRARAAALVGLPAGEAATLELVENEPWAAFNYYLGGLASRVAVNTDVPVYAHQVGHLVAHELYPGHHTERVTREAELVRARGFREHTIVLVGTPESTISEGIAELALETALGDRHHETLAELLRPHGLSYDAGVADRVVRAREALGHIGKNLALMLHEEGVAREEAHAYGVRWSLLPPERVDKSIEFVTDPTWRAYVACYTEGERLCRAFVAGDPRRFARLHREQLTPADLAAAAPTP